MVKTQGDGEDAALLASGLVTLAVAVFSANLMLHVPVTLDFSRWYAAAAMTVPLGILAPGVWGCWTALGGQNGSKARYWIEKLVQVPKRRN